MKNFVRSVILTLLLGGTLLTAAFADGGAPPILCFPGLCALDQSANGK